MSRKNFTEDWKLYEKGKEYNSQIGYKSACDKNERFYAGDQWYGVKAGNLPTPVFNMFKRITDYIVSYILSSPLKINYCSDNADAALLLNKYAATKWEKMKMDSMMRDLLLDAALSGDMATHTYWDPTLNIGNGVYGDFVTEAVDGINVFFGNVNDRHVQKQPYIILAGRAMTEDLRKEAMLYGMSKKQAQEIVSDNDCSDQMGDFSSIELDGKSTFLIKYYKGDNGKIYFTKSTKTVVIRDNIDTGLSRYPISFANYTKRKNCYHGEALGTGLAPNQIFINKIFAMAMKHLMDTAFPKAIYDKTKLSAWNNAVGSAVGVTGEIDGVAKYLEPAGMNGSVITLIDKAIQYTQENMGATDILLGQNVRPDNASAIISLQQSSAIPLDGIKQELYSFVEDIALIWLDFILNKYSVERTVPIVNDSFIDFAKITPQSIRNFEYTATVDVGPSTYWSEINAVKTLDSLLQNGHIDTVQYLKRLPSGYIPKINELISELEAVALEQPIEQADS
ncbi:MAG: hypothetical protein E7480_05545 [Ruminococcaceae bacterium]|nr:hypothetical protein [Oscillospiraceae bacterium]